jgi:7,8-dihydropterin-6-yl-methyl-4-(beta-D-ribofuranosyl)aminobenzene 5'-phosphate synthase
MKPTLSRRFWHGAFATLLVCSSVATAGAAGNSITVVSDHPAGKSKAELATRGGLAMYVKVNGKAILFDTGATDSPLLKNLEELGLDATLIEAVVISHSRSDHIHDLSGLLSGISGKARVFVPAPAGEAVSQQNPDAEVVPVSKPTRVLPDAWLVGPLQVDSGEGTTVGQALVLDRNDGLVVIVGCSYADVVSVVQQVKEVFGHRRIQLLAGGFHLRRISKNEIREISLNLQQKGVKGLALSQCTGSPGLKIFREEWGDRVVSLDYGDILRL